MLTAWLLYLGTGAIAGIMAGLLGIGGGLVIVPILNLTFTAQGLPGDYIQHLALGTSLATIIFTSISSMRAHHKRGALLWPVFKAITPGILIGGFLGSTVASLLSSRFLSAFFVVFLYYVSAQMLLNIKPKASREVPGPFGMFGAGGVIGGVSSLVGIGGGTMTVPFLTWCNVPMRTCIGTSAAVGLPIALASTAGYILNGLDANLPGISGGYLGFIYLPALFGVVVASVLTAPLGAKLAHNLPVGRLKKIFACLLLIVATRMLWALVGHSFL
ncbi:MAG: sulfite exporter TauE/SafE family protein [Humidesulfovibrio sp.]|nr:sulfite exporter TauE/SafE family protein [Humidesulfovibrio sp.]